MKVIDSHFAGVQAVLSDLAHGYALLETFEDGPIFSKNVA
jgi:hypothetical protein